MHLPRAALASGALLAVALAGCGAAPATFGAGYARVGATVEAAELERRMLAQVNADRAAAGLASLAGDADLADVARAHSADMVQRRFFEHVSPTSGTLDDRLDRAGLVCLEARENLATATSAEEAEASLLASPGHRKNLLAADVTRLGIGVVPGDAHGGMDGRMFTFTQVFARPAVLPPLAESRAAVARALSALRQGSLPEPPGWLANVASDEVAALPAGFDQGDLARVGKAAVAAVAAHREAGLRRVELDAQTVLDLEQFAPPAMVGAADVGALAWAVAPDRDARGRPVLKVLVLVAR